MSKVHPQARFSNNAHLSEDVKMIYSLSSTSSFHSFTSVFWKIGFTQKFLFLGTAVSLSAKFCSVDSY